MGRGTMPKVYAKFIPAEPWEDSDKPLGEIIEEGELLIFVEGREEPAAHFENDHACISTEIGINDRLDVLTLIMAIENLWKGK